MYVYCSYIEFENCYSNSTNCYLNIKINISILNLWYESKICYLSLENYIWIWNCLFESENWFFNFEFFKFEFKKLIWFENWEVSFGLLFFSFWIQVKKILIESKNGHLNIVIWFWKLTIRATTSEIVRKIIMTKYIV